jgi:hypothetical protein
VKRGFFCGDKTISFKRQKDTISIKSVILFGLLPILFVSYVFIKAKCVFNTFFLSLTRVQMWVAEFIFLEVDIEESEQSGLNQRVKLSWRRMLFWFKSYGVNLVFMLLVMDVTKVRN